MNEAQLQDTPSGQAPATEGWFVVNVRDAAWVTRPGFGSGARFESSDAAFQQFGINIRVLEPGDANARYHSETAQEDFLVLAGSCLLLVEGEERELHAWDFVHCPPGTEHVFVGAGDVPCAILAVGTRTGDGVVYPVSEVALKHAAGVEQEAHTGAEAYAGLQPDEDAEFQEAWLP